jgi:hypothetical protein
VAAGIAKRIALAKDFFVRSGARADLVRRLAQNRGAVLI